MQNQPELDPNEFDRNLHAAFTAAAQAEKLEVEAALELMLEPLPADVVKCSMCGACTSIRYEDGHIKNISHSPPRDCLEALHARVRVLEAEMRHLRKEGSQW